LTPENSSAGAGYSILARAAYRIGRSLGHVEVVVERMPPWVLLGALILADWAIAAEVGRIALHDGPLYYHGGDGTWYYTSAWLLGTGRLPYAAISFGYPLLIAPIAAIAGPSMLDGLPAIIAFNQLVLAPLALLCTYGIVRMMAGRCYAYLATLAWVIFPVAVIHYFLADYHTEYVDMTLPTALGLNGRGDFPSLVVLLVASYFTLRLGAGGRDLDALAAGLAVGLALMIKPSNALFVPAPLLVLFVARKWRGLGLASLAVLPSILGLALWKHRGLGNLPAFAGGRDGLLLASIALAMVAGIHLDLHRYLNFDWWHLHSNLDAIREYTWSQRMVYFCGLGGLVGLVRRSTPVALLAGTWLASFLIVKGSSPVVGFSDGSFLTHMVPAFPAYFLMVVSVPFLIPFWGRRRERPATTGLGRSRLPAAATGILSAITLAGVLAVGLLPTSTNAAAARTDRTLYIPLDAFRLSARATGRAVTLTWTGRLPSGIQGTFAVLRARRPISADCPYRGGSNLCYYTAPFIATVPRRLSSFVDHPPLGRWTYRVAMSASPIPPQQLTDFILLSNAQEVIVRASRTASGAHVASGA
jgi:hypothetical protein